MMLAFGKAIPLLWAKIRQSPRSRILFEKIPRDLGFQISKNLQGTRIIFFESYPNLIEEPRFLTPQSMLIPSEQFKLLSVIGVGLKRLSSVRDRS